MEKLTFGQKVADGVSSFLGSWTFIISQSAILTVYVIANVMGLVHFDPYPFILLNLILSFQAAYATPILMMSNNRRADIDRTNADLDLQTNVKSEAEVEMLMKQVDALHEKVDVLTGALRSMIAAKLG